MPMRARERGSLYREPDGWWRATYRVPCESRARRVRGPTRDEALRRRAEAFTRAPESRPASPATTILGSTTIAELAAWWLQAVASIRVRPSSLGKYVDRVERIAARQSKLLGSLAAKTAADTRATFRSIVDEAVNLGLVTTNPVDRVRPPKARPSARRALTATKHVHSSPRPQMIGSGGGHTAVRAGRA